MKVFQDQSRKDILTILQKAGLMHFYVRKSETGVQKLNAISFLKVMET